MNSSRKTPARSVERFALALPLALASCTGSSFSTGHADSGAGPGDDSGGGVILVGQDAGHDAGRAADSGMADARRDAHEAGPDSSEPDAKDGSPGCPTGMLDCGGSCVADGLTNCGACGHDCSNLAHVSGPTACTAGGKCAFAATSCASGWVDCDGNPDNGCETDTSQSPNCGGCGVACGGNTPVCDGSGCVSACSGSKSTLCNGTTCVDTTSDPQNCSACGAACPAGPANSQATCASSQCGYQCNATFTQCADGTCDDLTTDVANCGACGYDCNAKFTPPPNGTDICSSGSCDFTCAPGFNRCNLDNTCAAPAGVGAYVQVGSGFSTANCGTAASPCPTIQAGVDFAVKQQLAMVYVADGNYPESITIPAGAWLTVQGAWTLTGGTWTRDCPASIQSAIVAPDGSQQAILVTGGGGDVTLESLDIVNKGAPSPGETLYGVFAGPGANVHMKTVLIATGTGGAGSVGTTGADANPIAPTTCSAGSGGVGDPGGPGTGAPAGSYTDSGYSAGVGHAGGQGFEGYPGTAAPSPPCNKGNTCSWDFGPPKVCVEEAASGCATAGTNGCGGFGSDGGNPGSGGGSSIGVFAWGATVTLESLRITPGTGGAGGDGGGPGRVGAGSVGQVGTSAVTDTCTFSTCKVSFVLGAPSAAGGTGGPGGPGGKGGGGSGGDSYCYVTGGGGTVSYTPSLVAFDLGTGGLGGNQGGGTSQGATGNAGVHN